MKSILSLVITAMLFNTAVEAKLLDKISAIVDDNIITLSQVQRITKSLAIKKNVAPMIYDKSAYSNEEITAILVNKFLIRAKLAELGYSITDDQVEAQIKANEKRLNVDRKALMGFLKQQGSTFDEYFETLREAIEYSYFINRVISPTIAVSEQDVKNTYFKKNIKDTRMNFKYTLIDYSIGKDVMPKVDKGQLENVVKQYRINGVLPDAFSTLSVANLDDMTEEGIAPELKNLLKHTDEGTLSAPIVLNGQHHVFFIAKKDLVESQDFAKFKEQIQSDIFMSKGKSVTNHWFDREFSNYYINILL